MIRRVLRTELRRGVPPLAALLTAVTLTWMLLVHPDEWAGQWSGLAAYLRTSLLILGPVFVAAGAWQAGRDRRHRIEELLGSMPRPGWQPLVAAWAAVVLGGLAGLLPPLVLAAALTAVRATYTGTGWWWTALVGVLALPTAAALGVLVGRLLPLRVVAPVAGVATYVGLAVPQYFDDSRWQALSPVIGYASPSDVWSPGFHIWQAAWLAAVGALLLLLAARLWWTAAVPALVAAALLVVPARAGDTFAEPGTDAAANALVCTEQPAQVCVIRAHGFMLAEVAPILEPGLRRLAGVTGAPVRAVEEAAGPQAPGDVRFSLLRQIRLTGGVAERDWLAYSFGSMFHDERCPPEFQEATWTVTDDAIAWVEGRPTEKPVTRSEAAQKEWVGAVLAASQACDQERLQELGMS